jgi:hypothetical protein
MSTYLPLVRHLLQVLAGILITKGVLDNDTATQALDYTMEAIGGVMSLATLIWMIKAKKKPAVADPAKIVSLLAATFLGLSTVGCSTVSPGNDPVVVNAERTVALALETFDVFLLWEYDHREALAPVPEIRKVADKIRLGGQHWLASARILTKAYKENRTEENKVNLNAVLATLKAATQEAQSYLARN